ncbi:MAG: aspartate-semialdehyde dehydrogenase [Chlamydiota bacterium]
MKKTYKIALVGATGLVGSELRKVLEKSSLSITSLRGFASSNSVGKSFSFRDQKITIEPLEKSRLEGQDILFFCAGSAISKEYIPLIRSKNALIIDSSSAYRMHKDVPLVIPEINAHAIKNHSGLIASPNCTTTLMLMALAPLHKTFGIRRIVAATYQAASGGGQKLINKLLQDTKNYLTSTQTEDPMPYGFNLYLHNSALQTSRYTDEEIKMLTETHKILEDDTIKVTAMCVRVPVLRAHSIALNVELGTSFSLSEIYEHLQKMPGLQLMEDFTSNRFPTPFDVTEKNDVYCGRIRKDTSAENHLELWVVGDQLLKGAALNAVQIAESFALLDKETF